MELSKQEIELFLLLPELQTKSFFYKMCPNSSLKLVFKTGNGIIKTGKRIVFPTSWIPIKNHLLQNEVFINDFIPHLLPQKNGGTSLTFREKEVAYEGRAEERLYGGTDERRVENGWTCGREDGRKAEETRHFSFETPTLQKKKKR